MADYTGQFVPALGAGATSAYITVEGWLSSVLGRVTTGYLFANPDVGFHVYTTWQDIVNRNFGVLPMDGLAIAYNSLDYNLYNDRGHTNAIGL